MIQSGVLAFRDCCYYQTDLVLGNMRSDFIIGIVGTRDVDSGHCDLDSSRLKTVLTTCNLTLQENKRPETRVRLET